MHGPLVVADGGAQLATSPHYLIITHSVLVDHDLKIENNHRRADYGAFFNGELPPDYLRRGKNGAIYSVHAPGLPVLLLPAYAIGESRGAIVMMCLLGALAALAVFDVATLLGGPTIGLVTWISVCLTVPWMPFSWSLFPEMAAAAVVAWAVRWLVDRTREDFAVRRRRPSKDRARHDSGASAFWPWTAGRRSAAALPATKPWLRTAFVVVPAAQRLPAPRAWLCRSSFRLPGCTPSSSCCGSLAAFLLLRLRSGLWDAAAFSCPSSCRRRLDSDFSYVVYGTPDPTAPYGASADRVRFANLPRSLLGLLLDQKFGLPCTAPCTRRRSGGVVPAPRSRPAGSGARAPADGPVFVVSTSRYHMWWGGTKAPARFLVPVLPLVAPMIARALARDRGATDAATRTVAVSARLLVAALGCLAPALAAVQ